MKPQNILNLLKEDLSLRKFITAFHHRLALDNPKRDIAKNRTDDERAMDGLGRLLVGDEVCAAVAADGSRLFVASNATNHSQAQARIYLRQFIYAVNADKTRLKMQAETHVKFLKSDGASISEMNKVFDVAELQYDQAQHRLIPTHYHTPKLEIPYSEHGIAEFPFPIGLRLSQLKDFNLQPTDAVIPNAIIIQSLLSPGNPNGRPFVSRLDPLFRRSAVIFSHLGMICLYVKKEGQVLNGFEIFQKALLQNRKRVMQQTFGWEIPKSYKLHKAMRRYDDSDLKREQKKEYRTKRDEITQLQNFIATLTQDFNNYFEKHTSDNFSHVIQIWRESILDRITQKELIVPLFISHSKKYPLTKFIKLFSSYLYELLYLEKYIEIRCRSAPNQFTATLAQIGENETFGYEDENCGIVLIDEKLLEGTHAEIRLFHKFIVSEGRSPKLVPYMGITQLCCALCNTLFKSHGMHYIQGSRHRAGTHAEWQQCHSLIRQIRGRIWTACVVGALI